MRKRFSKSEIRSGAVDKRSGGAERFTAREIYRAQWAGLGQSAGVKAGLECLGEYGYVHIDKDTGKGCTWTVYVRPSLVDAN